MKKKDDLFVPDRTPLRALLSISRGSALALALIFVFVGTLITVSYLQYLMTASGQQRGHSTHDYATLIARAGIQMHMHKLQRMFFENVQSYTSGEIMTGHYEVLSRSYYDTGVRHLELISIGSHGKSKAALLKQVMVNTPTDYVRFFDGNYMNLLHKWYDAAGYKLPMPSLFWIGPVHSNGSIVLGVYDGDYPVKDKNPPNNKMHDIRDLDQSDFYYSDPGFNYMNFVLNARYLPNFNVNCSRYEKKPQYWGMLAFIIKDKEVKGPVLSTAGYFIIPRNYPQQFGTKNFMLETRSEDFANPILLGETEKPQIIVNIEDETYAINTNKVKDIYGDDLQKNRAGRFGLFNDIPRRSGTPSGTKYYNLVNGEPTATLAHGDNKTPLKDSKEGGFGFKCQPFLESGASHYVYNGRCAANMAYNVTRQMWGNAYDHPDLPVSRQLFSGFLPNGEFPYPLENYRDSMSRTCFPTDNTPHGLIRMGNSGGSIIQIPTIRKKIGGLDYANLPFKPLAKWRQDIKRFYRAYGDPQWTFTDIGNPSMVIVNHASREKMECKDDSMPAVYKEAKGIALENAKLRTDLYEEIYEENYSLSWNDGHKNSTDEIGRFYLTTKLAQTYMPDNQPQSAEFPMINRHIVRVSTTGSEGLWEKDYNIAYFMPRMEVSPNRAYFFKSTGGNRYAGLPSVKNGAMADYIAGSGYTNSDGYNVPLDPDCIVRPMNRVEHNIRTLNYKKEDYWKVYHEGATTVQQHYFSPHIQFAKPELIDGSGWIYLELTTGFINAGKGFNGCGNYNYDSPYYLVDSLASSATTNRASLNDHSSFPNVPTGPGMFSETNIPPVPATGYTPHTNTGVFLGRQDAKKIGRYLTNDKLHDMMQEFKSNSIQAAQTQCGFQVPVDIFGSVCMGPYNNYPGNSRRIYYYIVRRIIANIRNPIALKNKENMLGSLSTNELTNQDLINAAGGGVSIDIIRIRSSNHGDQLITNFGGDVPDRIWINPWFKLHFLTGTKDAGTNTTNVDHRETGAYGGHLYPFRPAESGTKNYGVEWYNIHNSINLPFMYNYCITSSRKIVPTWESSTWQSLQSYVPKDRKWFAPLAEKVKVLDLSRITAVNFPRANIARNEPGVIFSEVPLLVYGNPEVPLTVVCTKNIYLKSINGYFPATRNGLPVKNLGQNDKPSVGIISCEGVWTVPVSEKKGDNYSIPGGSGDIILNNVAIWTTKGFFSLMAFSPKIVLAGSVVTMNSMFGKIYHPSYENFGESFVGFTGSRSPISGLGATDICYRANELEGVMAPSREAYVYSKMFRGDDLQTSNLREGPPPHFPIYFKSVVDKKCRLEYALKYFEFYGPYIKQRLPIPPVVIRQLENVTKD